MYIETRYFDTGKVFAKLHKGFAYPHLEDVDCCDRYVESIGKSTVQTDFDDRCDYESLESWLEELEIELDDVVPLLLDLEQGLLVEITAYC
jgi:hypothetical protein